MNGFFLLSQLKLFGNFNSLEQIVELKIFLLELRLRIRRVEFGAHFLNFLGVEEFELLVAHCTELLELVELEGVEFVSLQLLSSPPFLGHVFVKGINYLDLIHLLSLQVDQGLLLFVQICVSLNILAECNWVLKSIALVTLSLVLRGFTQAFFVLGNALDELLDSVYRFKQFLVSQRQPCGRVFPLHQAS